MDEWFEIFDRDGNLLGRKLRGEVHRDGDWHRATHVFLFDSAGNMCLQQRAASKDVCPNCWDLGVGEHLTPGESWENGAMRGLREELGVAGFDLVALGPVVRSEYHAAGIVDRELQMSFAGRYTGKLQLDPAEVAATRTATLPALDQQIELAPDQFTHWFKSEYRRHREALQAYANISRAP